MSLLRRDTPTSAEDWLSERRAYRTSSSTVTAEQAMRNGVVWASMRLRADMVSQMPVDVYRRVGPILVGVDTPAVLKSPQDFAEGHPSSIGDWLYSSQMALDGWGNSVGIVTARDGLGFPRQIELVKPEEVAFRISGSRIIEYKINGESVPSREIWHERQHVWPGMPVGLSPITFAALTLGGALNAQRFMVDWFAGGAVPSAILRNEATTLTPIQAEQMKRRFLDSVSVGQPFTTGKDWTYEPIQAKAAESGFIEQMNYSALDLCRFFGVPGDLVDVAVQGGSSITYANVTQRNLQFLIQNLGPAVKRREEALSQLTPSPRVVKLNSSALLRMDDKTRAEVNQIRVNTRERTPDELRAKDDFEPLTEEQYAQFDRLFGSKNATPAAKGTAA